ncbi:MFS transporter [Nonomuraea sp. CA-143628]|uniref:MFS transporter n=1 Tax=Nonomuraea sp. CA-143628 TaxID=3239997 RepID=UPI003D948512
MNEARTFGAERRRWMGLGVLLIAAFMDLLNGSIINVAVPTIRDDLDASYADIQWIIAGYTLACAVTLITGGRLGDIFGRKRMFLVGTAGFTTASALCALAQTPAMLVGARVLQGLMAAIMLPQVLAIIHLGFRRRELGTVVTLYAAIGGLAMVGGPIIGGLLLDLNPFGLAWRGIFLLNLPVGAAALLLAAVLLEESRAPHALRLDLIGVLLVTTALFLLVYPLAPGRELGWPAWSLVSLVSFVAFVVHERRKTRGDGSPLIELGLFAARGYTAGLLLQLLLLCVISGFFFTWTLYLQLGLGWSPLHTGLTTIPFTLGATIAGGMSMRLYPRFGRRSLMAGVAMMIAGVLVYGWQAGGHGTQITSSEMIAPLLLLGVGLGQVIVPLTALTLADVPPQEAGGASGIINAVSQLGTVLGIALIGVVFFTAVGHQAARGLERAVPRVQQQLSMAAGLPEPARDRILADFRACVIGQNSGRDRPGLSVPCGRGAHGPGTLDDTLAGAADAVRREAFAQSFRNSLWYVLGALVAVLSLLFALPGRAIPPEPRPAPARSRRSA